MSSGHGEKSEDSRSFFKIGATGFHDGLNLGSMRRDRVHDKNDSGFGLCTESHSYRS